MKEVKEMSGQLFKNAVMPNEKMADNLKDNTHNDVDLGKLVRGVMTGSWENATKERDYLNVIQSSGDGKVLIPQRLSANIFDTARAKSAVFGKVPVLQLINGNLTIAKVAKDPRAHFVGEGEAIPFSDVTFAPIKLKSKILAMLVPVSEILLKDGQNVGEALHMAMAGALAEAMDNALLYGEGDGSEDTSAPKGILTYADINKATFKDSITYTDLVKGVKPVAKANLTATNAVMPTDEYYDLLSSTNANGDFLAPPKALEGIELDGSNNVADGQAVVFDRNAVIVGVSPYLMIERGYTNDQFAKLQKTFRLYMGVDIALVNPKGVTHITKSNK
jgi:HK97 family phage major capsid protein